MEVTLRGKRVNQIEQRARELGISESELIDQIIEQHLKQGVRAPIEAEILQMRARKGPVTEQ